MTQPQTTVYSGVRVPSALLVEVGAQQTELRIGPESEGKHGLGSDTAGRRGLAPAFGLPLHSVALTQQTEHSNVSEDPQVSYLVLHILAAWLRTLLVVSCSSPLSCNTTCCSYTVLQRIPQLWCYLGVLWRMCCGATATGAKLSQCPIWKKEVKTFCCPLTLWKQT